MLDASTTKAPALSAGSSRGLSVLAACTLGVMMTLPGRTAGIAPFLDPILLDLGLSRSDATGLFMAGTLGAACVVPFIGRWLDAYNPRRVVAVVVLLFALTCFGMSLVSGAATLLLGLFALRALGQGGLWLVSRYTLNQWFVRRRGLAMGIAGVGLAIASSAFPYVMQPIIMAGGWRAGFVSCGLALMMLMLPVGLGFFRNPPEDEVVQGTGPLSSPAVEEFHWRLDEALKTFTFWFFAMGAFLAAGVETALVLHHYSLMAHVGVARETASAMFVTYGIFNAAATLISGILLDRVSPRPILAGNLAMLILALPMVTHADSFPVLLAYGGLVGAATGTTVTLVTTIWACLYGRRHLGSIKGFAQTMHTLGTALGPLPFALALDQTGSYTPALLGSGILVGGLFLVALFFVPLSALKRAVLGQPAA